jgi:hypothetical protein
LGWVKRTLMKNWLHSFYDELEKIAEDESAKKKAIRGAVTARPWVKDTVKGAVTGGIAANLLFGQRKKITSAGALMGAGAAAGDRLLRGWAKKNPRRKAAKELREQTKLGALGGDLRRNGIGGVKRPPMPTEDSKQHAAQQFMNSTKPGKFMNSTQPRHLRGPGPSIHQVSSLPTG